MNSSNVQVEKPRAQHLVITDDSLAVELTDGRTISVPLAWYPRLLHANREERDNWRLIGAGEGIHWPDLDEDLSIESLIVGSPSGESAQSLKRWLESRKKGPQSGRRRPDSRRASAHKARRGASKTSTAL